jgi:hypothetical protein
MIAAVPDLADMSKPDVKRGLDALDDIVLAELGSANVTARIPRPVDGARQARHQQAHRTQPGDPRGEQRTRPCLRASTCERVHWPGRKRRFRRCRGPAPARGVERTGLTVRPAVVGKAAYGGKQLVQPQRQVIAAAPG